MKYIHLPLYLILILATTACKEKIQDSKEEPTSEFGLVDKNATPETVALYEKISTLGEKGIAVGHQDDTSYGLGWKHENMDEVRSDVQLVTGDFPAVFGFDIGWLEIDKAYNLDTVPFNDMRELIMDAYKRGGIITISWHLNNPETGGSSWNQSDATSQILEGGPLRETYVSWVEKVAVFFHSLEVNAIKVPVVFRPYHEMTGSWFWWGGNNTTFENYKKLWIDTVTLLRDKHNVHNVLYSYSPNKMGPENNYLDYYPGDDYVDILGMDIYDFNDSEEFITSTKQHLAALKKIATDKNMPYAFTETGLESVQTENWYTEVLYPAIKDSGISWVLTWRNYDTKHHYMPYKGHLNEQDFINFKNYPDILFLEDIKDLTKN